MGLVGGFLLGLIFCFTQAALFQWLLSRIKINRLTLPSLWLTVVVLLPPGFFLVTKTESSAIMWLSPIPLVALIDLSQPHLWVLGFSLMTQALMISVSYWRFNRYLHRLGQSESQRYFQSVSLPES